MSPAQRLLIWSCVLISLTGCAPAAIPPTPATTSQSAPLPEWDKQVRDLLDAQDFAEALKAINAVLEREPTNVAALILRSRVYRNTGDFAASLTDAIKATELEPQNPRAWISHGHALRESGDLRAVEMAARTSYARALELDSKHADAWYGRGLICYAKGEYEQAVAEYTKAIELGDVEGEYHYQRGYAFTAQDKAAEAVEDFSAAIQLSPDDDYFHYARADALAHLKRYDEAIADCSKMIELKPEEAFNYLSRADIYIRKGDYQQGAKDWIQSIELDPTNAGKGYQPLHDVPLSDEALRHGEEQLKAILRDRPAMAEYVKPGDRLWTWTVRKLAGEDVGEPVYWNPQPLQNFRACHGFPTSTSIGFIQLTSDTSMRGDKGTDFEFFWAGLVYELHNMTFAMRFQRVSSEAQAGKLSRENSVVETSQIEREAEQLKSAFYAHVFLPWADEAGFRESNPENWFVGIPLKQPSQDVLPALQEFNNSYVRHYSAEYDVDAAQANFADGEYAKAREKIEAILSDEQELDDGPIAKAKCYLGKALLAMDERGSALEAFKTAVALDDQWMEGYIAPARAKKWFGKPLKDETKINAAAHALRGTAWSELGEIESVLGDYNRALEIDPEYNAARILRAGSLTARGDYDQAISDLDLVLEADPENISALIARAGAWDGKGETEKAIADYTEYIRLAPQLAWGWGVRASKYSQLGEHEKAIADLDRAIQCDPHDGQGLLLRAQEYMSLREYDKALADCSLLVMQSPNDPQGYFLRGKTRCLLGDFAAGVRDYEQAMKLEAMDSYILIQRAMLWIDTEEYEKALQDCERFKDSPDAAWAWALAADIHVRRGEFDQAKTAIEKSQETDPGVLPTVRGRLHAALGESQEALDIFNRLAEDGAIHPESFANRAEFLSECQDPDIRNTAKAIEDATKACELSYWREPNYLARLAACHAEAGDFEKAIEWQTKAVALAQGGWKPKYERDLETFKAHKTLRE